jgi:hypothetical protein
MLDHWHEFYILLGTAAAALLALLFVAASIGAGLLGKENAGATRTFMSPIVFHYANIVFLSLIALIPTQTPQSFSLTILIAALGSLAYSIFIFARIMRNAMADLADKLAYGGAPVVVYATGVVVAALIQFGSTTVGLNLLAGAALLLLLVNIRNAWDTTLSLVRRATEQRSKDER